MPPEVVRAITGAVPDWVRVPVLVQTPQHSGLIGALDYRHTEALPVGALVRVPLGRRTVTGVVWHASTDNTDMPMSALKDIVEALPDVPPLPATWCTLIKFSATYYQRGLGEMAMMVLPPELRQLDAVQWARRVKRLRTIVASWPKGVDGAASVSSQALRPALTDEQVQVMAALSADTALPGHTSLLWGATGSGKTEVFLRRAETALDAGQQVLMMVPEINLTPQLEDRVAARFAGRVVVSLHSGLTPAQRLRNWMLAHLGLADIVLGTRLAVFTPMPRLGLIVVDEEHDPSYKQQDGARYSARDLAVYRGQLEKAQVILGSATPSLETWHRAMPVAEGGAGRYACLKMPSRVGLGAMPKVRLLDLSKQAKPAAGQQALVLAQPLLDALEERLARGEQSLVLLNRRGYAPALQCSDCGWKSQCAHCSAWRVFHKGDRTLRCHHCGFTERVPRACPDCGNLDIHPVGRGTERLEEQLAEALPQARVGRIDADVTRLKGALEERLASVHAGEVDILVGTQMVAKGHDFRRITLVAAVNPDAALFVSDFRAGERLFSLLLQAAGRAGRDAQAAERSEMWIQTWHPTHPLYQALTQYDYEAFARQQLLERQMAGLPPFAHLAMLRSEAKTQEAAQAFLLHAAQSLETLPQFVEGITVYPAVPTAVQRVANVERAQMLIEVQSRPVLQHLLAHAQSLWLGVAHAHRSKGLIRWAVDVDPLSI